MDGRGTAIAGAGLVMLPLFRWIAAAEQVIKMTMVDFLLADIIHRFVYLRIGLAFVLAFIGVKMMIVDIYKIPTSVSLSVVAGLIGASVVDSLLRQPRGPAESATTQDRNAA